jgi:hypothetical protein
MVSGALISAVGLAILLVRAGISVESSGYESGVLALLWIGGALLCWLWRNPASRLEVIGRNIAEFVPLFVLVCIMGAVASYPVAATSSGFADARLEEIDRWFGFNWLAWYDVVAAHRPFQLIGAAIYETIYLSPTILLIYHAINHRVAEARAFTAAFWLAAVISLLFFAAMPARGPLAVLWHGPIPYMPRAALDEATLIPLLRSHLLSTVDLGALRGLVCAPSFHAASATLFIAFALRAGALRWPLVLLNVAMLIVTPVEGTHYLVDILGGIAIALVSVWLVRLASARFLHGVVQPAD